MNNSNCKLFIGSKYYKYNNDKELEMYRLVKYNEKEDTYKLKCGKIIKDLSYEDVLNEYIKLKPDCTINIFSTHRESDTDNHRDVFICVHKLNESPDGSPDMLIRQNIYSTSKNAYNIGLEDIYLGDCFNKMTLNEGDNITNFMDFDGIDDKFTFNAYIDDTFDIIYRLIPQSFADKMKEVLEEIKKTNNNPIFKGYSKSLKDLFIDNNFMLNFKLCFNIMQLDFPIYITESNKTKDGSIVLNNKQHKKLEDLLRQNISISVILEYDRDIDISKIVQYTHIMVSDSNDKMYLIAYNKIKDYPVDDDVLSGLGLI